jgi:hypothetical protein
MIIFVCLGTLFAGKRSFPSFASSLRTSVEVTTHPHELTWQQLKKILFFGGNGFF